MTPLADFGIILGMKTASLKQFKHLQASIRRDLENHDIFKAIKLPVSSSIEDIIDQLKAQEDYYRSESNRLRRDEDGKGNDFSFCLCHRTAGVPLQEMIWMPPQFASNLIVAFADSIASFRQKLEDFTKLKRDFPLGTRS